MSRQLAEMVLASERDASLWYELGDAFRDEGFEGDANILDVDGMTQDMVDRARKVING